MSYTYIFNPIYPYLYADVYRSHIHIGSVRCRGEYMEVNPSNSNVWIQTQYDRLPDACASLYRAYRMNNWNRYFDRHDNKENIERTR